ncbi:hypothetical protein A1O3_00364 [Capronia epimyces CBS 606.96]|uniref:Telomeric single stranded DNA binding POT1/Cdc13 domain-containing protein n=1 Tax=Capronia epimyces CBS 606.96 TaxID=1182542 RepID=W9ZBA0_9EURO|nr:uncharacterized protein A1O3_00364 [Capronia epimyces CBS 606.96]EXJ91814.1 hypothetical protein A1O3_00364 [Capronia epimyces CBS 606.96]
MTPVAQQQPTAPAFEPSDCIPIAHLSPSSARPASHIQAKVALVWPYSSSTGSLSLLLADPDIRLRKYKGQVRVVFRDGCAREIAKTKVGIGDTIDLALVGCEWKNTGETVSTPGKKIDWDLEFHDRAILQVVRDQNQTAVVNYTGRASSSPPTTDVTTPLANLQATSPRLNGILPREQSTIQVQLTPFKSTRQYSSGSLIGASLGPFAEDDGYVLGKGRKRTKFARNSGAWSLVDSEDAEEPNRSIQTNLNDAEPMPPGLSPQQAEIDFTSDRTGDNADQPTEAGIVSKSATSSSPVPHTPNRETEESFSLRPSTAATEEHTISTTVVMGPPWTPLRALPLDRTSNKAISDQAPSEEQYDETSTPRILPLASPGLPLVSPLIRRSGVELGYFPLHREPMSQLEASGEGQGFPALRQNGTAGADYVTLVSDDMAPLSEETFVQRQASSGENPGAHGVDEDVHGEEAHENTIPKRLDSRSISPDLNSLQNGALTARPGLLEDADDEQALTPLEERPALQVVAGPDTEPVEIEDDDLYGAPKATPRSSILVANLTSLQQPQSSADTVEQYLQMSPTTTIPYAAGSSISDVPQSPASQHSPALDSSSVSWEGKMTVVAVECQSLGTYPVPPFPFKKNWHKAKGSGSSSRRSSRHSQHQSLDGNVDGDDSFPLHQSEVHESPLYPLEAPGAGRIEDQSVASEKDVHGTLGESQETMDIDSVDDVVTISTDEDHSVGPDIEEVVEVSPASDATHRQELPGQLLTPDQTQRDRIEIDSESAINSANQQPLSLIEPLSPRPTQEVTTTVQLQEEVQMQIRHESATPTVSTPESNPEPGQTTYRRTFQRLSVRKSVMSANISSPYFTPRKETPEVSSPLSRNETLTVPEPVVSSLPSSPTHEPSKSVKLPLSVHEVGHAGIDMTFPEERNQNGEVAQQRKGTTTSLSYYPHLTSIPEHFGDLVDVIAICVRRSSEPQRSKSGPKDYYTTLRLADPSLDSEEVATTAQIFRPVKSALPVTEYGDVVIMRNLKVQTLNRQYMLLSTDTSSWAVIKVSNRAEPPMWDAVVSGPPIEHGPGEALYVESLLRWWENDGEEQFPDRPTSEQERGNTWDESSHQGTPALSRIKENVLSHNWALPANRRKANFTDNINNDGETDEVVVEDDLDETTPLDDKTNRRRESTVSTARSTTRDLGKESTPRRSVKSRASPNLVHELRDGTKYVDHDRRRSGSVIHELRDGATYVDD